MPGIPATVRSLPTLGTAVYTALRHGDRVPYLGVKAQQWRMAHGRKLAVIGLVAFVCSVWLRIVVVSHHPRDLWLTIDLDVYYEAGKSLPHGQSGLYTSGFGLGGLPYLYPPFTALVFEHLAWINFDDLRGLTAGVSIACLVTVAWSAWGMLGCRAGLGRLGATGAVAAVGIWLEPVHSNLNLGQVNMVLLALVVWDLAQSDRSWGKGVGIGLATAIKLTPGLFVVYLLLTRRIKAAVVATGTFVVVSGGVWAVLPKASRDFWFHAIGVTPFGRDYAANQSFQGMFLRLLHNNDAEAKYPWLLASALLVVVGLAVAALAANRGAELLAGCVVGIVTLEISPISWTCHWVWFEPLMVLAVYAAMRSGQLRTRVWAAVGVIAALAWPMRVGADGGSDPNAPLIPTGLINYAPRSQGREEAWDPFQMLFGNAYVLCGVAFIVAVMVLELRRLTTQNADELTVPAPGEPEPTPLPQTASAASAN